MFEQIVYGNHLLQYEDEEHLYYLDGENIPSVTTILDEKAKPHLKIWAVKLACEAVDNLWKVGEPYNQRRKDAILKNAKNAHWRALHESAASGSIAHDWFEEYALYSINNNNLRPEILFDHEVEDQDVPPDCMVLPSDLNAAASVSEFLKWIEENEVEFQDAECKIVSLKHRWAGTRDVRAIINGRKSVLDYKTSKSISPSYFIQESAYAKGGEEMGEEPVDDMWILRVPQYGGEFEAKCHTSLGCGYSIDELYDVFLGLKTVWNFNNGSKRRVKKIKEVNVPT